MCITLVLMPHPAARAAVSGHQQSDFGPAAALLWPVLYLLSRAQGRLPLCGKVVLTAEHIRPKKYGQPKRAVYINR
ncbi:MAG: hypothetical protein JWQ17_5482 [Tardiphaga sp.]|nr:hypothetical protein [Tardiphaga sp.]